MAEPYSPEEESRTNPHDWTDDALIAEIKARYRATTQLLQDHYEPDQVLLRTTSFSAEYNRVPDETATKIREITQNMPMTDLGGKEGLPEAIRERLGIGNYRVVDMQKSYYPDSVEDDALSYLNSLVHEDGSVDETNVMSNGFLTTDIFGSGWTKDDTPEAKNPNAIITKEYLTRLFTRITDVLPENGIFIATHMDAPMRRLAQENGLELNEELTTYYPQSEYNPRPREPQIVVFNKRTTTQPHGR